MVDKLIFLGSGGSMGVPVIGCLCEVCTSSSPKNKRLRPSVLLKIDEKCFVIDMGPDYREQALRYRINRLDGLLLTHAHYDHVGGLDESRIYTLRNQRPLPCLLSQETLSELKRRYDYLVSPCAGEATQLKLQILQDDRDETIFEGLRVKYCFYTQMRMCVNGFRVKNLAYITDITKYDDKLFHALKGTRTLIISAQRWARSGAHLSIDQIIHVARKTHAEKIYLTHISHEIHHEKIMKTLPTGFALTYDGMELTL